MIANFMIGVVAVIHLAFAGLEIFRAENVPKLLLGFEEGPAKDVAVLVQNQGAYNLFFALGLIALLTPLIPEGQKGALAFFCLASLAAAGLVGLVTVGNIAGYWKIGSVIFLVQMIPAVVALWLVWRGQQ